MTIATEKPAEPRQMLTLLQRQRDGYRQLIELGRQQTQVIHEGQGEQLLALLSRRQALIDELADLGRQIAGFHQHWSDVSAELGEAAADQVRKLVAEVEQLLAQVIEQDERDRAALESTHRRTGSQLKHTASAPRALGAYKTAAAHAPRFTDRQG